MFFYTGKRTLVAFLIALFLAFLPNVSAQTKNPNRKADVEIRIKKLPTESETISENIRTKYSPGLDDLQKLIQSKEFSNKIEAEQPNIEKNERFIRFINPETKDLTNRFRSNDSRERLSKLKSRFNDNDKIPLRHIASDLSDDTDNPPPEEGFKWRSAIQQSLVFLAVQHGYAFTQPKTREALKGKFFKDYADSVKSLHGWDDGGKFFTNYIAHPMQGSMTGFIYVQNDPKAARQKFGLSGDYWRSRLKAMAWTTVWSVQFEIGPISQASIGNIGLKGKQTWEDIIVTPTLGTAMLVTEDALDRFVMQPIERKTDNFYIRIFSRMLLSPTRIFANLLRFKAPWYRDRPTAH